MTARTIHVLIDPNQLAALKTNNLSLYLAKRVNGTFTVIWQSMRPFPTGRNPVSYEDVNTFVIDIASYHVNYTNSTLRPGLAFAVSGKNQPINVGQTVSLNIFGIFGSPTKGTAGLITVTNSLQGKPHEILMDAAGNNIFVNTSCGMDIGRATLTPTDTYQIWFGGYQETGTIMIDNIGNAGTVSFSGEAEQTISYDSAGAWITGPLTGTQGFQPDKQNQAAFDKPNNAAPPSAVKVSVTLTPLLSVTTWRYLTENLNTKFSGNLKPSRIINFSSARSLMIEFSNDTGLDRAALGDAYISAVNAALTAAKNDSNFNLTAESWTLFEETSHLY